MQRWLMKTEPDTFSIDDLRARKVEPWNGVRNYQRSFSGPHSVVKFEHLKPTRTSYTM